MQLGQPGMQARTATTLAEGLRLAAAAEGHRPAITVLGAGAQQERRDEQSFASLQQWVAKGAHLLEVDAGLGPGDALLLDAPAGWMAASVCLAAWWLGAAITDDPSQAIAAVIHESRPVGSLESWCLGDALDGSPTAEVTAPSWAIEVQGFPDHPPVARATDDAIALHLDGRAWTQSAVLAQARNLGAGRLGVHGRDAPMAWMIALAARPAATAEPTVLVIEATDSAQEAERIATWR